MAILVERDFVVGARPVDEIDRTWHLGVVQWGVGHRIAYRIGSASNQDVGDEVKVVLVGNGLAAHNGVDGLKCRVPIQHGLH